MDDGVIVEWSIVEWSIVESVAGVVVVTGADGEVTESAGAVVLGVCVTLGSKLFVSGIVDESVGVVVEGSVVVVAGSVFVVVSAVVAGCGVWVVVVSAGFDVVELGVLLSVCVVVCDGSGDGLGVCAKARPVAVTIVNSAAAANRFEIMGPLLTSPKKFVRGAS